MADFRPRSATHSDPAVLVLDGDQGATLAIVRSVRRRGVTVDVGSDVARPLAALSRYARAHVGYPDPMRDEHAFIDWLAAWQRAQPTTVVIPVTERTVVPIHRHRDRLAMARIAVAPADALETVLDKERTLTLAASIGVPVPRSTPVRTLDDLDAAAAGHAYPVVVKPSRSVGRGSEGRVHLTVSYAYDASELRAQVRHALAYGEVLLQEYFEGDGIGIELIADHGEVHYIFQHRRLHEVPLTGGGSSLRISETPIDALRTAAGALVRALGWHGVAMIEFKYQPQTGAFRLMEINGRFWGSLPLATGAGADFPAMLLALMRDGRVGDWPSARAGIVGRQLARDIDWFEQVFRSRAMRAPVRIPTRRQALADALLVFSPRHRFDVQQFSDPWPGMVDLWRIALRQIGRVGSALRGRVRLWGARLGAAVPLSGARRRAATARSALFVCHGNINRSALAQAYATQRLDGRLALASAGFHPVAGRAADPLMVATALRHGIDLSRARSRTLTRQDIEDADIVFVMELQHADRIVREFPSAHGKVLLLGAALARRAASVEIHDPYGKAPEMYDRICRQVVESVDAWISRAGRSSAT